MPGEISASFGRGTQCMRGGGGALEARRYMKRVQRMLVGLPVDHDHAGLGQRLGWLHEGTCNLEVQPIFFGRSAG